MKARLPKGYGRPDPNAMMRQVQKMQDDIRAKQEELEAKEYTGTASGEMVTVTMNGKHEITAVKIKPEAVDPDDIEMLEDLIAAAVNSASSAVDKDSEEEMSKMTGGLNIPGLRNRRWSWLRLSSTPKRICTAAVSVRTSPQVMSARSVRPKSGTAA